MIKIGLKAKNMSRLLAGFSALTIGLLASLNSHADLNLGVPFDIDEGGAGFGSVPRILTFDTTPGNEPGQAQNGMVGWDGSADTFTGPIDMGKSGTVLASTVNFGTNIFGVFMNINEAGSVKDVYVDTITLKLIIGNSSTDYELDVDDTFAQVGGGNGGQGVFFPVFSTDGTLSDFFGNDDGTYRIGLGASIDGATNGAESFSVGTAVPEPSAFLYGGVVALIAGLGYRRRQKSVA